jgi:hypothetical protein
VCAKENIILMNALSFTPQPLAINIALYFQTSGVYNSLYIFPKLIMSYTEDGAIIYCIYFCKKKTM